MNFKNEKCKHLIKNNYLSKGNQQFTKHEVLFKNVEHLNNKQFSKIANNNTVIKMTERKSMRAE